MPFAFIYLFILSCSLTWAGELTEAQVRSAKRIVVLTGTFDPWTNDDLAKAKALLSSGEADLVVTLPISQAEVGTPLPMKKRLEFMRLGQEGAEAVAYPGGVFEAQTGSLTELTEKLKSLNPGATIRASRAPKTNLNIRQWMKDNVDDYFSTTRRSPPNLSPAAYEKIVSDGLYLGRSPVPHNFVHSTLQFIVNETTKRGWYDKVRAVAVKVLAKPNLREFDIGTEKVKIERYLASGLIGDAYITEIDGQRVVLKVGKDSEAARQAMNQATLTHAWVRKNTSIVLPEIHAVGEKGEWQALELIQGEPLDKFIAKNGGTLPPETEEKLRRFYEEAAGLNERSAIKLDISADNIFIRASDGAPVLVDFGPIASTHLFAANFETAKNRWLAAGARLMGPTFAIDGKGCDFKSFDLLLSR